MTPRDLSSPDNSDPPLAPGQTQRVLVVIDGREREALVGGLCTLERFEFVAVRDFDDALNQAELVNPDLLLMDELLPGVSGLELCADVRASEGLRHIPIIILTEGRPGPTAASAALLSGADDYCSTDPEYRAELRARMLVQLRNKRYRDALGRLRHERNDLRRQASKDSLTGALGRRALEEAVQNEFESDRNFAVLFVDIDHFKSVNDNYGHQIGDEVLKRVAQTLQLGRRTHDVCGRYGGEEFVLVLRQVNSAQAVAAAERLRRAVAAMQFIDCEGPRQVTVSIGVAGFEPDLPDETPYSLLRRADAALYRAKREGRNRVVLAPDCALLPLESGSRGLLRREAD